MKNPSRVISALRKLWMMSPERGEVVKNAKIKIGSGILGYKCQICGDIGMIFEVDHIIPVGSYKDGWDSVIEKMFCPSSGLQLLCKECHKKKGEEKGGIH